MGIKCFPDVCSNACAGTDKLVGQYAFYLGVLMGSVFMIKRKLTPKEKIACFMALAFLLQS